MAAKRKKAFGKAFIIQDRQPGGGGGGRGGEKDDDGNKKEEGSTLEDVTLFYIWISSIALLSEKCKKFNRINMAFRSLEVLPFSDKMVGRHLLIYTH